MDTPVFPGSPAERWPEGPVVCAVAWHFSEHQVRTAAGLAASLGLHLVCAFVDPASYLTEWDPIGARTAGSMDPAGSDEAQFPSGYVLRGLEAVGVAVVLAENRNLLYLSSRGRDRTVGGV
jgi:hypothetical protein